MKKITIFILTVILVLSVCIVPAGAQNYLNDIEKGDGTNDVKLNCRVDYLISLDNDSVIVDKNSTVPCAPASLTKIMTALVVLEHEKNLNRFVTVDEEALETLAGTGSSTSGLKAGEQLSVSDLLRCLLIPSGNDAAVVLAKEYGGSIAGFVDMMNETAKRLGCKNTNFENPHGLDSPGHKTTAQDLALITKSALKHAQFKEIVAMNSCELPQTNKNEERTIHNTNYLLDEGHSTYYYKYCTGIKTGSTDAAGRCLISSASKDGYNYLCITMGGDYRDSDNDKIEENQAFMDAKHMFEWVFDNLKFEIVAEEGQFICSRPLKYCWSSESVRLTAAKEIIALMPSGSDKESIYFLCDSLKDAYGANEIRKGQKVGTAKIMFAENQIESVDIVVADDARFSLLLCIKAKLESSVIKTLLAILIVVIFIGAVAFILSMIKTNKMKRKSRVEYVKYREMERNTVKKKQKKKREDKY